jgi:hypothetical protein
MVVVVASLFLMRRDEMLRGDEMAAPVLSLLLNADERGGHGSSRGGRGVRGSIAHSDRRVP